MNLKALSAALLVLSTPASAEGLKIEKESDYNKIVVGRTMTYGNGTYIKITPGRLTGKTNKGEKVSGSWTWEGRFFCRTVKIGTRTFPKDCQTVEIIGDQIILTRNKGRGEKSPSATLSD